MQDRLSPVFVVTNGARLTTWEGPHMARDMLQVDGVSPETKAQLQEAARQLYGQANASLLVRSLIASHLAKPGVELRAKPLDFSGGTVRVELRLPRETVDSIKNLAETRFSTHNYYINALIHEHLGLPQLHGDEIEVLRRSNYELAKVGTNLNQIAKAFNLLVKMQGDGKPPEVDKKIEYLRKEIKEHTLKVLKILESKTALWEAKGRGQKFSGRK